MSVDELIHKLAGWPGNFEVYAHNINGDYRRVEDAEVYLKEKADEAITELKARIANLEGLNHDLCERVTENDGIRQHWEEIEQTRAENERLKAKFVEQGAENHRLKHSLYNLRAVYANMMQKRNIECKTDGWVHRINKWIEVERRCIKKAEEYR